ncbi:epoxide hydrolase 1-like [Culicoides brevitarsis]|uniref:epoxide hydrolase 1-like n=1 Tax=Culicoides brevitarsis TaxID=469753 RepID=UPI00307B9A67
MSSVTLLLKSIVSYVLILFYNLQVLFGLGLLFIFKNKSEFWEPKPRPDPPKNLTDKEHGDHKFIEVNGIRLHYVEKGDKSKPLMLFVHGFPEFWYSWRHQLKEFSKDYWCIALDMRGYNESDKPKGIENYSIDCMTSDIREVVRKLDREKFILVCHDWGSVIGWHYVTKHMDTIEKYICMGAPSLPVINRMIHSSWKQFRMSWYVFFFQMPWLPETSVRLFDMKSLDFIGHNSTEVTKDDIEVYKHVFGKEGALTGPINYYRANFSFNKEFDIPKPDKFAPGLYLLGEHDLYISKGSGPLLQKEFKNLEFKVVAKANHFCQQDKPKEVNEMMREFLSQKY